MKLLIADDETYTREGLMQSLPWEEYGIDEVMQADNGKMALKIAKWFYPNIVLTDIRMPQKDGIEFVRELLKITPDCKIIFMTGYMQVDYLKSAIELGAIAFVEKPINIPKVVEAIDKALQEVEYSKEQQRLQQDSKEYSKQRLLQAFIYKNNQRKVVLHLCEEADFPVGEKINYRFILIKRKKNSEELDYEMEIRQFFEKQRAECIISEIEHGLFYIALAFWEKDAKEIDAASRRFMAFKIYYIMACGFVVADIMNLYNSYQTATVALDYAFYDREQRYFEIDEKVMDQAVISPRIFNEFSQYHKKMPYQIQKWFDAFIEQLVGYKYYRRSKVILLFKSFIHAILEENKGVLEYLEEFHSEKEIDFLFDSVDTIFELQHILHKITNALTISLEQGSKYSRVISDVLDYIQEHYSDSDLSVQKLADNVNLSTTYLNILFKKELSTTIKQYISNIRMDKAKELLKNEYIGMDEIAVKCGYSNANYFTKVFRENMNMTPTTYRSRKEI